MNNKILFTSSVFIISVCFLFSLVFSFSSFVNASESNDFILTEDSFSSTENSASSSDIISESIILPIQYIGETTGDVRERTHELSVCGNGIQEFQEICDGADFNGKTCNDFGFNSGTLTCSSNCLALVTGGCNNSNSGLLQTPTPTPIPTSTVISSGGSGGSSSGGSGSSGGRGGNDPLLLITPTPTPTSVPTVTPTSSAIPSFHPAATEAPKETISGGMISSPTPTSVQINFNDIDTDNENSENSENANSIKSLTSYEWVEIDNSIDNLEQQFDIAENESKKEKISPYDYADYTPLLGDVFGEEKSSLIEIENSSENIFEFPENKNINLHSSPPLENNNSLFGFGCGKYFFIILLITFLLGMLTEYILSSILLIQKK